MKQHTKGVIKGIIIGFLISALLFGGVITVTGASTIWKKIDVAYDNYKIVIDGKEFVAKDKNGSVIDSFSYNGWIFSPFEHIAKALGKPVVWDGKTKTLYIGDMNGTLSEPTVYLQDLDYFTGSKLTVDDNIGDYHKDNLGNIRTNVIYCGSNYGSFTNVYKINGKYSKIDGYLFQRYAWRSKGYKSTLTIYGDGNLLYGAEMNSGIEPVYFKANLDGVSELKIVFSTDSYLGWSYAALSDVGLWQ